MLCIDKNAAVEVHPWLSASNISVESSLVKPDPPSEGVT